MYLINKENDNKPRWGTINLMRHESQLGQENHPCTIIKAFHRNAVMFLQFFSTGFVYAIT